MLLLYVPLAANANARPHKEVVVSAGVHRSYYAFVPDAVTLATPGPLLVLLHGSGQDGLSLLRWWTELAAAEGIVLIAPNSRDPMYWRLDDDGPGFLRDVIDAAVSRHAIDRRRVYLFGISGGAVYALTLSILESEFFAATAVFAGAWRDEESLALVPHARRKIPVSIFVGDRDEYFPAKSARATDQALRKSGHPGSLTLLKRQGHSYAGAAGTVNRDAWTFLAAVRLGMEPRFQSYGHD